MTLEDNKHVVRRFLEELFGAGNLHLLDELVASHAVHIPVNKANLTVTTDANAGAFASLSAIRKVIGLRARRFNPNQETMQFGIRCFKGLARRLECFDGTNGKFLTHF